MSKYTPGPWTVYLGSKTCAFIPVGNKEKEWFVQVAECTWSTNPDSPPYRPFSEAEANATLIAAAPDLAAACLRLVQAYQRGEQNGGSVAWEDIDDAFFAATAALDKADIEYEMDEENEQETTH
jgi:hypothetical protein